MSGVIDVLSSQALIGITRLNIHWPEYPHEIQPLAHAIRENSPTIETAFLRIAGMYALCEKSGYEALSIYASVTRPEAETAYIVEHPELIARLAEIFSEGWERLQYECLTRLAAQQWVVAHTLLPALLELGHRRSHLRSVINPVLGVRGRWLATHNTAWKWVHHPDTPSINWEDSSPPQRLLWLETHLKASKKQALQLIEETLPKASARERLQLLEKLATFAEIKAEDENFLTAQLQDRSKDVRYLIASLLSSLATSAFSQRMSVRLKSCLQLQGKSLVFIPPEYFDLNWKKDSLEEDKPPYEELGSRAWWAYQLVSLTSLEAWLQLTGMTPEALLNWAVHSDWQEVLLRGWMQALKTQKNSQWAEAWLEFAIPKLVAKKIYVEPYQILSYLPLERRDRYWCKLIHAMSEKEDIGLFLRRLFASYPLGSSLSVELASAMMDRLMGYDKQRDYALIQLIPELACVLPEEMLLMAQKSIVYETFSRIASQESASHFISIIKQRTILNSVLRDIHL